MYDVVVAGAGLPGLSLATALARAKLRVALADGAPIAAPVANGAPYDLRVYAISPGSAQFLHGIGAWQRLPVDRVTAVEGMDIEGDAHARLAFSAYDLHERALAWIVEERELKAALLESALEAGVAMHGGAPFVGLTFDTGDAVLTVATGATPEALRGRLMVAADGLRSWVRQAAGIVAEPRPYGQTGVVANFACERAHRGVARQWFRADGSVLAWLPLPEGHVSGAGPSQAANSAPSGGSEQRTRASVGGHISIVWSAPDAMAAELLAMSPDDLASRVAAAGGDGLGAMKPVSPSAGFPLSLLRLPTTVAHRLALVGDAAHGVHPLAGQGVNLGFGDARVLAQLLAERGPVNDPGAPLLLARYAQRRVEPVLAMQVVTDGLARLFGPPSPWLSAIRNAGMAAVDRLPLLKRALAQPALR
jgi:2-polyprenyl-6-methoxyphenol hydroxylase-like FAD-dependent oxidoreductase